MLISQRIVHIAHILYPYNSAKRLNCITTLATAIAKARQDVVISLDDEFNPDKHPRDKNNGRFIGELKELKSTIKEGLMNPDSEMPKIEATRENYQRLTRKGEIKTPIGTVKIGEHQFEKLVSHNRKNLLGAMFDVLESPKLITQEKDKEGRNALVYIKSYKGKNAKPDCVVSVVVDIENQQVSILTHQRKSNQVLNRITAPEQVIFNSFG